MKSGITLKEIAKILGYSSSTISKALNDSNEISVATKKTIVEAVKLLGYKPNFFAYGLRSKKSLILGVILPDLKDIYFLNLLIGITEESSKNGYKIMVYQSCNDYKKEITYTKFLSDSDIIDGFIFSPTNKTIISKNNLHLNDIDKKRIPIVFIEKHGTFRFSSNIPTAKSKEILSKKSGFESGENSVKKLLAKIKREQINLNA